MSRHFVFIALIFAFNLLVVRATDAAMVSTQTFQATAAAHPLPLDPNLRDPLWATGAIPGTSGFEDVTTRSNAKLPTSVDLLYDNTNLYVAFHVEQGGAPITATQSANDIGFGIDDFVGIGIDTSGNGEQVYYFETTPRGVRYQQASENARYTPDWQAAANVQGNAWNAVMVIPLKALRIRNGTHSWRVNFIRGVAAVAEHYTWAYDGLMQDSSNGQGNWPFFTDARYWPSLTNINLTQTASASRAKPHAEVYALSSTGSDRKLFSQANGQFLRQDVRNTGVDFTYPLSNTINFVGTANPDFSNVEIDQQTIAPQEFRRALQEYRPFFAQGANYLNPNAAPASIITFPDQTFYSPGVGPFDRGEKIEGTYGKQSFGVMNFRGGDQTTGNEFDDIAYGFTHAEPTRSFLYWADGVVAHHSISGDDSTNEAGLEGRNVKNGFVWGLNQSYESGSWVPSPRFARLFNGFADVHKPNYEVDFDYQDISPNYNPIDGFTSASDERGPAEFVTFSGSSNSVKNYSVFLYADRFFDRSGQVHQSDTLGQLSATFKNGFSITGFGPTVGILRSYALDNPSKAIYPLGCADPALPYSSFTGYPNYYCGRSDRFNLFGGTLGFHDGTPTPIDVGYQEGPFGGTFAHILTLTASRPLGTHFSVSGEYGNTIERSFTASALESQTLRRLTLGETLGSDSNVSVSLRSISGIGGFAIPGLNLAASYHRRFANGNDLYLNFGTPAANATLDRLVVKYVFRAGGESGT